MHVFTECVLSADPQKRHLVQLKFQKKGSYINARDPALVTSILNLVKSILSVYKRI